jgi:crotonobetainyl-CoA:carnitine CoA-transferase CaiB-like acyl-CoA transferase
MNSSGPLAGYRVIELGQLLAGPFAGCMLGYFGAEVIKIESPDGGDPIRRWREMRGDTSLWWRSLARNKKSVTIDLKTEKGVELVRRLIAQADVVIENFRPGVVEKWGLGPEDFRSSNPGLVYARISGYGQDGPYASKPGFASVCEGMSGFRYVNGQPGEAPVRPNLSIGDTISGIHAALGIALALLEKKRSGEGQVVDVALVESMFNLMEAVVPEYDGNGVIREPSGSTVTGIWPPIRDLPPTRDGLNTRQRSIARCRNGVPRTIRPTCCSNSTRRACRRGRYTMSRICSTTSTSMHAACSSRWKSTENR